MKESYIKNLVNRRERKAARQRDYVRAAYYAADHDKRYGLCVWTLVNAFRRPVNLGRPDGREE